MLYSVKDREDLENLNKLVSIQNQVKTVRLQDKLGKQNFQENMKKFLTLLLNRLNKLLKISRKL